MVLTWPQDVSWPNADRFILTDQDDPVRLQKELTGLILQDMEVPFAYEMFITMEGIESVAEYTLTFDEQYRFVSSKGSWSAEGSDGTTFHIFRDGKLLLAADTSYYDVYETEVIRLHRDLMPYKGILHSTRYDDEAGGDEGVVEIQLLDRTKFTDYESGYRTYLQNAIDFLIRLKDSVVFEGDIAIVTEQIVDETYGYEVIESQYFEMDSSLFAVLVGRK